MSRYSDYSNVQGGKFSGPFVDSRVVEAMFNQDGVPECFADLEAT